MRKTRTDFRENRNKTIALAKLEGGLSYNDIARNPELNPDNLSLQRIQQIVKDWERRSQKGQENEFSTKGS